MPQSPLSRLKLLGAPAFVLSGSPVELGSNKALAMLAYLALSREPVARSELDVMFWPDSETLKARRSLREELSRLRKHLPTGLLRCQGQYVSLESSVRVDVWAFESALSEGRWERACTLYTGELLEGLFVRNAGSFETWLASERERLQGRYVQVLHQLGQKAFQAGEIGVALAYAQQIIATNPLTEGAYLQAMRLAQGIGETAIALEIYHSLLLLLRREFGIAPSGEAAALAREIATASRAAVA